MRFGYIMTTPMALRWLSVRIQANDPGQYNVPLSRGGLRRDAPEVVDWCEATIRRITSKTWEFKGNLVPV